MRICKNKITDLIRKNYGANPLKVPESRIQPLTVIEVKDKRMNFLGSFKYLLQGEVPEFPAFQNSTLSDISGVKTKSINIRIGFNILGGFLKAFGMDPSAVTSAVGNTKKLAFSFEQVNRKYIEPLALGHMLSSNALKGDPNNFMVQEILKDSDRQLALITDVIESNNFAMSTFTSSDAGADINIPAIEGYIAEANVNVNVNKKQANEVAFTGAQPLTFAFACVEIDIDPNTGKFSRGDWLKNIRTAKNMSAITEEEVSKEDWNTHSKLQLDENEANPLMLEF